MTLADDFENKLEKGALPRPIPRWVVVAKRAGLWVGFGALVTLGALALGVTLWLVSDPALREDTPFLALLGAIPFIWLGASLLTGIVAVLVYRFTPHGYRHRLPAVVFAVFALAILVGFGLMASGVSERTEETVSSALPPYHDLSNRRIMRFADPQNGTMVGWVVSKDDDTSFELRDPASNLWYVDASGAPLPQGGLPAAGSCLRVIGENATGTSGFVAKILRRCPRGVRPPLPPMPAPPTD